MDVTFTSGSAYVQYNLSFVSCDVCGACIVDGNWQERDRLAAIHAEWHRSISPSK